MKPDVLPRNDSFSFSVNCTQFSRDHFLLHTSLLFTVFSVDDKSHSQPNDYHHINNMYISAYVKSRNKHKETGKTLILPLISFPCCVFSVSSLQSCTLEWNKIHISKSVENRRTDSPDWLNPIQLFMWSVNGCYSSSAWICLANQKEGSKPLKTDKAANVLYDYYCMLKAVHKNLNGDDW